MTGDKFVYFGNLFPNEPQYQSDQFVGLALHPKFDKDIPHDARASMPFKDNSIAGFQSQDVFEHVESSKVPGIFNDIYRCMKPGGIFRLSLPDYNSPLLRKRSAYDHTGKVLYDVAMGGALKASMSGEVETLFPEGGDVHLWFPTYNELLSLILVSEIRKCDKIEFHHYWLSSDQYIVQDFDQSIMPVSRTPPRDMRADGKPISIVVDFTK